MKIKGLTILSKNYNLSYNDKKKIVHGKYRGYDICIFYDMNTNRYNLIIPTKARVDDNKDTIKTFLNERQLSSKKILFSSYENYNIKMQFSNVSIKENKDDIIQDFIEKVIDFLEKNDFTSCCQSCGEEVDTETILIGIKPVFYCRDCRANIQNDIAQAQEDVMSKKSNLLTGIIGGFLGSLIGVIVWVIIYSLGYLAAIGGLVIAICTIKGFELFGGKINKIGIIITFSITIIMVYVAQYTSLGFGIYEVFKNEAGITILDAMRAVPEFLLESEISKSFYGDLAIGYLLTLVGSISTFVNTYKHRNIDIKVESI